MVHQEGMDNNHHSKDMAAVLLPVNMASLPLNNTAEEADILDKAMGLLEHIRDKDMDRAPTINHRNTASKDMVSKAADMEDPLRSLVGNMWSEQVIR